MMPAPSRRTLFWWATGPLCAVAAGWIALVAHRAHLRAEAIAALADVDIVVFAGSAYMLEGGCVPIESREKVADPVKFALHGPQWLRETIGEEACHKWLDTPVAFDLAGSEANDADIAGIRYIRNLQRLDLSGTKVTDAGLAALVDLKTLVELRLASSEISDAGLARLRGLRSLANLQLQSSLTTDDGFDSIAELKSLQRLEYSGRITNHGLEKLARLPKLRVLELNQRCDETTDEGLAFVASMERLEKLSLLSANVTDAGIKNLARLENLRELYLGYMPNLSAAALTDLRNQLPEMNLVYEPDGPLPPPP